MQGVHKLPRKLITIEEVENLYVDYNLTRCGGERIEGSFKTWETLTLLENAGLGERIDILIKRPATRVLRNIMITEISRTWDNDMHYGITTEYRFVLFPEYEMQQSLPKLYK